MLLGVYMININHWQSLLLLSLLFQGTDAQPGHNIYKPDYLNLSENTGRQRSLIALLQNCWWLFIRQFVPRFCFNDHSFWFVYAGLVSKDHLRGQTSITMGRISSAAVLALGIMDGCSVWAPWKPELWRLLARRIQGRERINLCHGWCLLWVSYTNLIFIRAPAIRSEATPCVLRCVVGTGILYSTFLNLHRRARRHLGPCVYRCRYMTVSQPYLLMNSFDLGCSVGCFKWRKSSSGGAGVNDCNKPAGLCSPGFLPLFPVLAASFIMSYYWTGHVPTSSRKEEEQSHSREFWCSPVRLASSLLGHDHHRQKHLHLFSTLCSART